MSEQAKQWLLANPDHPKAEAVRQKLSAMEAQGAPQTPETPDLKVVNEAHPAVSWKDRTLVKNFGIDSGKSYLEKKYPNLNFQEKNGDLLIKGNKEAEWRKLDPSTLELADVSDIAYDVASGIAEGAATLGGAVAGTGAAPGAGTLAGGMAAGAAAGGASEALRQKIGQALGINEDMSGMQIGAATLAGGLSPALFGAGKLGKGAAKNLAGDIAERGLIPGKIIGDTYQAATRKFAPELAAVTSGEKAKVYKDYIGNLAEMESWRQDPAKFENFVKDAGRTFEDSLKANLKTAGDDIGKVLKELPDTESSQLIEIKPLVDDLVGQAKEMIGQGEGVFDPIAEKQGTDILNELKQRFGIWEKVKKKITDPDTGKTSTKTVKRFKGWKDSVSYDEAKKIQKGFTELNKRFSRDTTGSDKASVMSRLGNDAYAGLKERIDTSLEAVEGGLGERLRAANAKYRSALDIKNRLEKEVFKRDRGTGLKDYSKAFATLRNLDQNAKRLLKEEMGRIDPKIIEKADKIEAFNRLSDPSFFPTSGPSATATKTLAMAGLGGAAGAMGGDQQSATIGLGVGLLGMGPRAWKFYLSMGKRGEDIIRDAFRKAGQKPPASIRKYFNRQMASQGAWNAMREREGE